MRSGVLVELDDRLALEAAELSIETKLALADSIILATAHAHDAELWTQDSDFKAWKASDTAPRSNVSAKAS